MTCVNNGVFLLFSNYNTVIIDFHRILINVYDLDVWPKYDSSARFFINNLFIEKTKNDYLKINYDAKKTEIRKRKLVICILNNQFFESKNCIELLEYAHTLNKSVLAIIIENIDNDYEFIKQNSMKKISHKFEIYKERIYKIGYDQWMWISGCFKCFITQLELDLGIKLV